MITMYIALWALAATTIAVTIIVAKINHDFDSTWGVHVGKKKERSKKCS